MSTVIKIHYRWLLPSIELHLDLHKPASNKFDATFSSFETTVAKKKKNNNLKVAFFRKYIKKNSNNAFKQQNVYADKHAEYTIVSYKIRVLQQFKTGILLQTTIRI